MVNFEVILLDNIFFPKKKIIWILKLFRESITVVLSKRSFLRGSDILLVFSESPSYLRITGGTSLKFDITTFTGRLQLFGTHIFMYLFRTNWTTKMLDSNYESAGIEDSKMVHHFTEKLKLSCADNFLWFN